ncbi:MAG TPA: lysine--tRNA ligase [Candidatus Pacearchaeota archaeon]|nr:lysine--tRNA ligase [Candidatus Pacearchaeota archaeon]
MGREEQIINERKRKLEGLREKRINPYPNKFDREDNVEDCLKRRIGKKVKTAGRLITKRDIGKIIFSDLRDSTGEIQIVFQDKETPKKSVDLFRKFIDAGDIVGLEGKIIKTKTGQHSILVEKFEILAKSLLPLPSKWYGLQDKEERYRKRYLDLIMNPKTRKVFETRTKIIEVLRNFLSKEKFMEVETPILQSLYGGASARPFKTHLNALDIDLFLAISPELYLKRLIVGGIERVYTICKNFRNEGMDSFHNPEFTMMEYYAAYENYEYHIKFTEDLFNELRRKLKLPNVIEYQGKKINITTPFKRVKFRDILLKETKIDINKADNFEKLKKEIFSKKLGVDIEGCKHYGALLDEIYKRVVRSKIIQPTFLTHYPAEMIALAKRNEKDPRKINSVQLLIDGAELVKSYDELNDPLEQEVRLGEQANLIKKGDEEAMPMDEDYVNSLKMGMPPTAGYGLGVDRLVMLLTNQPSVRDVILFPFMKPEK